MDLINKYNKIVHHKSHTGQDIHTVDVYTVRYTTLTMTQESTYPSISIPVWESITGYFYTDDENLLHDVLFKQHIDKLTLIESEGDEYHFNGVYITRVDRNLNEPKVTVDFKAKSVYKEMNIMGDRT